MTKDELRQMITKLRTDPVVEEVLTTAIDQATEINEELRVFVAQTLERQAAFFDAAAEILLDGIPEEDQFAPLNETAKQKLEPILSGQEQLLNEMEQSLLKKQDTPTLSQDDTKAVQNITEALKEEDSSQTEKVEIPKSVQTSEPT